MEKRKPESDFKDQVISIRMTSNQKNKINKAAKKSGLGLSSWILSTSLEAASSKKKHRKYKDDDDDDDEDYGGEIVHIDENTDQKTKDFFLALQKAHQVFNKK
jgi:hypothetical protein